jgi:hypothetical protein
MRGSSRQQLGLCALVALLLMGMASASHSQSYSAEAHMINFGCEGTSQTPGTCGDDHYYCTLIVSEGCWYDGDTNGCSPSSCWTNHSYTYQSALNDNTGHNDVVVVICGDAGCPVQSGDNFVRMCIHHHANWVNDLDCDDQDGYTRQARTIRGGPSSGVQHGSPWW